MGIYVFLKEDSTLIVKGHSIIIIPSFLCDNAKTDGKPRIKRLLPLASQCP
jgi:hypothetical protein